MMYKAAIHHPRLAGVAALMMAVGIGACAVTAPASPGMLASPQVQRGHQIYISDCASCHRARDPRSYSKRRWEVVLPRMESRADLSPEDARSLEAYIAAVLDAAGSAPK